jgi:hypothetical protein
MIPVVHVIPNAVPSLGRRAAQLGELSSLHGPCQSRPESKPQWTGWLTAARVAVGPIFRAINRAQRIGKGGFSPIESWVTFPVYTVASDCACGVATISSSVISTASGTPRLLAVSVCGHRSISSRNMVL